MRIVIDMQGAQFCNLSDPIAEHAINFARAICEHSDGHEVMLALQGRHPASVEQIRAQFQELLSQDKIRVWYGAERTDLTAGDQANANELIREAFLASLQPDILHYTGDLFRPGENSAAFSIGRLGESAPVTACLQQFHEVLTEEALEERRKVKIKGVRAFFDSETASETSNTTTASVKSAKNVLVALNEEHKIHRVSALASAKESVTCARDVIDIWSGLCQGSDLKADEIRHNGTKLRLAYVSPLPPERTGIADYSAELLLFLSEYYEIIVISDQKSISAPSIARHCQHHDSQWLRANKTSIDRVLYHVGNSEFHKHMPALLADVPGVVVLHDFYLSGLYAWLECVDARAPVWTDALYTSHGYRAVAQRFREPAGAQRDYPVCFDIVSRAQGVIVHSEYARTLAETWYPRIDVQRWVRIPLLRLPSSDLDKAEARRLLGIRQEAFVVCSFGFMGESKLNHRLLEAWKASLLSSDSNGLLIFVGELPAGEYHIRIHGYLKQNKLSNQVKITGFADADTYRLYLQAADVAVQLRSTSRGESSAAILDCMNYGVAVIANGNGAMAELDPSTLVLLEDNFTTDHLASALVELRNDAQERALLGSRAREYIIREHAPLHCAKLYAFAIEKFHSENRADFRAALAKIADSLPDGITDGALRKLSLAIAQTFPTPKPHNTLYVDITATIQNDLKTGIERVARAITIELLDAPPEGYRVEPVYLSYRDGRWCYMHAHRYTASVLGIPPLQARDELAEITAEDTVLGLDISGAALIGSVEQGFIDGLRLKGTRVLFMVFDLLPIRMPHVFPPGAEESHQKWLKAVSSTDGAIAISQHVAEDYKSWIEEANLHSTRLRPFQVSYIHLGADIDRSLPSKGFSPDDAKTLKRIRSRISFLMIGTIEPRKGYLETLEAFEKLWRDGHDLNLVIVGREGWQGLPEHMRRDIPETLRRLRNHPETGEHLFWLDGISDEFLVRLYASSTCLIAASYGEGFGLPLIEAAQHRLPIIARDIPVFREIAGDHAYYFSGENSDELASSIRAWLALYVEDHVPPSAGMPWITWKESAARLSSILLARDKRTAFGSSSVGKTNCIA